MLKLAVILAVHALTLHSSRGNFSKDRRLVFASCYTRDNNVQWKDPYIPCLPCPVVDDDKIVSRWPAVSASRGPLGV